MKRGLSLDCRLRRGRARPARRTRGRRRRHSRSGARSARLERFQETGRAGARRALRHHLRPCAGRRRLRFARAHRPRQYPAGVVMGAGARGRRPSGPPASRLRRWPRSHRRALRLPGRDQRRRAGLVHRRGVDRRQSDARPPDEADRRWRIPATASSAIWAMPCRSIARLCDRLGPTIHHRRSFSPVALAYGDIIAEISEAEAQLLV